MVDNKISDDWPMKANTIFLDTNHITLQKTEKIPEFSLYVDTKYTIEQHSYCLIFLDFNLSIFFFLFRCVVRLVSLFSNNSEDDSSLPIKQEVMHTNILQIKFEFTFIFLTVKLHNFKTAKIDI